MAKRKSQNSKPSHQWNISRTSTATQKKQNKTEQNKAEQKTKKNKQETKQIINRALMP